MIRQTRPGELIDILRTDFQHRNEPNFAWKSAVSAGLGLPGVRAFWPMSSVGYTLGGSARDIAGAGQHLTNNNSADFGYDGLASYVHFDGINQSLSRADGGGANWADITGTEAWILAAAQGLSFGCWVYFDNAAAANENIIAKWGAAGQRSYHLMRNAAGNLIGEVSVDGTAITTETGQAIPATTWTFVALVFDPGNTLTVFTNDIKDSMAGPASVFDSTSNFYIGVNSAGAGYMTGRVSLAPLCAMFLNDANILTFFHQTRAMFGV